MNHNIKEGNLLKAKAAKLKKSKANKENRMAISRNYSSTSDLELSKKNLNGYKFYKNSPKMSPILEEHKTETKDLPQEVHCHESPIPQAISQAPM